MKAHDAEPEVTIALDAVDCSNRCRHCEVVMGSHQRHLSRDEIRAWAERVRGEGQRLGIEVEVGLTNTELLDHPQWREICDDLGCARFAHGFPTNGRQIAREPTLIDELRERGVESIQLTLGGGSAATHDAFAGRPGSFDDIVHSARAVLTRGMRVAWAYIAYRPLAEVADMSALARSIVGDEVDESIFLVKPQRAGAKMEDLRPIRAELEQLPEHLRGRFPTWCGAACETEGELVAAIVRGDRQIGCLETGDGHLSWSLVVYRNGDVYPLCHEREPAFLIGNLDRDGLGRVVERLRGADVPALALRRKGLPELAARYGDPAGDSLHSGCSLCRTLVRRALAREGGAQ
jgi:MoaA/NifB/PqqE/SkfB family radical SAM enzyme